ncbi:unnamed protein product [Lactuca virosa]|uniref:Uncharacterized protein n=1 Tax=Lactuca virosa TaxID=75947 RepID=A0AAU9M1H8_9ASTR|nr:unnamed protein product [Lactuca virosa]
MMVPEIVIMKLKKLKSNLKSSGVVMKEKLRTRTIKEPSTTATPIPNTFEADHNSEETDYEFFGIEYLTFHVSPQKDATVESNIKETINPYVTIHASNVDTNSDSGEPISTFLPETTNVTPPKGSISKSKMEEGRSSNIIVNLSNKESNVTMDEDTSISAPDNSTVPPPPSSPPPTSTIPSTKNIVVSPAFFRYHK